MSGQYPDPESTFLVKGVVVRDPNQGATYVHVSIRDGEKLYLDVSCFDDGPIAEFRQLKGGMKVKIAGFLGKRKVKDLVDAKGRQVYETQLLARRIAVEGMPALGLAPTPPQAPQYQPPLMPQGFTYPQWVAYQQQQAADVAAKSYQQQPAQHAAQLNPTDDLPF